MVEQLWPAGQHNAAVMVVVVFSERHTVFSPQQKSEGNPLPHCERAESPPHVSARLVRVQSSFSHSCGIHSVRADTARSMQGSAMRVVKVNMMGGKASAVPAAGKCRCYLYCWGSSRRVLQTKETRKDSRPASGRRASETTEGRREGKRQK